MLRSNTLNIFYMFYICTRSSSKETEIEFLKAYLESRNAGPRGREGILEHIDST